MPNTVKIFTGQRGEIPLAPARRAVLSVPAHLEPARKRRAQSCSHQHSTGIPHPPSAHSRRGMKWRELGASGEGKPQYSVGVSARRAGECGSDKCGIGLAVENIQTVQTAVDSHVGQ